MHNPHHTRTPLHTSSNTRHTACTAHHTCRHTHTHTTTPRAHTAHHTMHRTIHSTPHTSHITHEATHTTHHTAHITHHATHYTRHTSPTTQPAGEADRWHAKADGRLPCQPVRPVQEVSLLEFRTWTNVSRVNAHACFPCSWAEVPGSSSVSLEGAPENANTQFTSHGNACHMPRTTWITHTHTVQPRRVRRCAHHDHTRIPHPPENLSGVVDHPVCWRTPGTPL